MAITVLGTSYANVIDNAPNSRQHFIDTVKAIAAFYFIWRSALSTSGLDSAYRRYFDNLFQRSEEFNLNNLKLHLRSCLAEKNIDTYDKWNSNSQAYLKYENASSSIIRLALLICAHDTIADPNNPGLMMKGRSSYAPYLTLRQWLSTDLSTIEHIAPQTNDNGLWDVNLYDAEKRTYNTIGNLSLLPLKLNASVGNKSWKVKWFYYKCVGEQNAAALQELEAEASRLNIELKRDSIEKLKNCNYNKHLDPISALGKDATWNLEIVNRRTSIMQRIIWDTVSPWIFS